MALPIGAADLVADERVGGVGVGDAQERLGEAHQDHALLGREAVFVQERVEPALPDPLLAHAAHEVARALGDAVERVRRQRGRLDELLDGASLVGTGGGAHLLPERIRRGRRGGEDDHGERSTMKPGGPKVPLPAGRGWRASASRVRVSAGGGPVAQLVRADRS